MFIITILIYTLFFCCVCVYTAQFLLRPEKYAHKDPEAIAKGALVVLITGAIYALHGIVKETLGTQESTAESFIWIAVSYTTGKILDDTAFAKNKSEMYKNLFFIESFAIGVASLIVWNGKADPIFWLQMASPKLIDTIILCAKYVIQKIRNKETKSLVNKGEIATLIRFAFFITVLIIASQKGAIIPFVLMFAPVFVLGVLLATFVDRIEKNIGSKPFKK